MTQTAISIDFLGAYARIPRKAQRKADAFVQKFREDPTSQAINYERIQSARDERLRSVRIGDDYRAILRAPEHGDVFVLLWIDHHDEAYRWAKNKQTDVHPVTGTLQVFDIPSAGPPPPQLPEEDEHEEFPSPPVGLFEAFNDEQLFHSGVPQALLPAVRAVASDDQLEGLIPHLPEEAGEVLTGLAAGLELDAVLEEVLGRPATAPVVPVEAPAIDPNNIAAALARETSQRKFRVLDEDFDLDAALRWPLDAWRVFLHPKQRSIARARTKGPMRVLGAAGTGKTVVALHRAAFLARTVYMEPSDRILVTTFTRNLATDLRGMLGKLLTESELSRIDVVNLDAWAASMLSAEGAQLRLANDTERNRAWNRAIDLYGEDGIRREFYISEWEDVVLEQDLRAEEEYVRCRRLRRGTRLSRSERRRLWPVFERYRTELDDRGIAEPVDVLREARRRVEATPERFRFASVVVDETQDFSTEALRLVRALAGPEHGDDIFLVGDAHQRIYGRPVSLSACGINIRGRRSRYLRLNYRTTAAISKWSLTALRGEEFDDLDTGTVDLRGYTSLREGQPPVVEHFESAVEEQRFVAQQVQAALEAGLAPESVCVAARTHSQLRSSYGPTLEALGITYEEIGPEEPAPGRVRLATMHRIKGLEFSLVLVAGVNEGLVPLRTPELSSDDPVVARLALLRERCLLYVASSRARDRLIVTSYGKRSRFLDVAAKAPPRHSTLPAPRAPSVIPARATTPPAPAVENAANRPLEQLPLPTRVQSWAEANEIRTVGELVAWLPDDLVREKNVGRTSVAQTRSILEAQLGTSWEAARAELVPPAVESEAEAPKGPVRWDDLRRVLKPSVLDAPVDEVALPTRLLNHAVAHGMTTVRELVAVPAHELRAAKNLGRTSVAKGLEALLAHAEELENAAGVLELGFLPLWKEQLSALDALPRMVITNRSGLAGTQQTLQALGEMLGVTRERVRQIEQSTIEKLCAKPRWIAHIRARLGAALVGGAVAVADLDAEAWWSGVERRAEALDYFCERFLEDFHVVRVDDDILLARADQNPVDAAWTELRRAVTKIQVPAPEAELLALLEPARAAIGATLADRLWERLQGELIIEDGVPGERRVLAIGDSKGAQVLAYLRACPEPVSIHDVYERFGRVHFPDEVLFFRRGLIGLQQHFPDFASWRDRLAPLAADLMRREGPERQWSVPELHEELSEVEPLPEWLGHWHLASLLRQSKEVSYLGRLRVALPGVADDGGRLHMKTALVEALKERGAPMDRKALIAEGRARTGTAETTLSLAILLPPFVRLDGDTVGLLDRDLPGGAAAVVQATERIQGWLAQRDEGATIYELHKHLVVAWGGAAAGWADDTVLSVLRSDARFRLSQSGNVGLAEWDSVRVPSRLKLVEEALRGSTERVSVEDVQQSIVARYGKPVERSALNAMVNRLGAGLDGEWIVISRGQ